MDWQAEIVFILDLVTYLYALRLELVVWAGVYLALLFFGYGKLCALSIIRFLICTM